MDEVVPNMNMFGPFGAALCPIFLQENGGFVILIHHSVFPIVALGLQEIVHPNDFQHALVDANQLCLCDA